MRTSKTLLLLLIWLPLVSACSGTVTLKSRAMKATPVIDGDPADWSGQLESVEGAPFSLGIQNDEQMLYLALVSANSAFCEQLARQGLVLWFDPEGGEEKSSGLGYPRGADGQGFNRPGREELTPEERIAKMEASFEEQLGTLEFRGSEGSSWSMDLEDLQGLALSANLEGGRFFYEAAIPLYKGPDRSFSIGLAAAKEFTLGLEVPAPNRPERGQGPPAGMAGGRGSGGMGGKRSGGMGGPPGGGRGGPPQGAEGAETIGHWVKNELN